MRTVRMLAAAALTGAALFGLAAPSAVADSPSATVSPGEDTRSTAGPTEAGDDLPYRRPVSSGAAGHRPGGDR